MKSKDKPLITLQKMGSNGLKRVKKTPSLFTVQCTLNTMQNMDMFLDEVHYIFL